MLIFSYNQAAGIYEGKRVAEEARAVKKANKKRKKPMNTTLVTTGLRPLTIGSTETFEGSDFIDGIFWDLTGGSATLTLLGPNSTTILLTATITAGVPLATWTVSNPPGDWTRTWTLTDATGRVQVSNKIAFTVVDALH
jgi:hypothetical protein